jgi:hypothetical protein
MMKEINLMTKELSFLYNLMKKTMKFIILLVFVSGTYTNHSR